MKNRKSLIGLIVSLILLIFLCNPQWLPVSDKTEWAMGELRKAHFLLEGNSQLTLAHLLTLVMALCLIWLVYSVLVWVLHLTGKRNSRAATVTELLCGLLKYLAIIFGYIAALYFVIYMIVYVPEMTDALKMQGTDPSLFYPLYPLLNLPSGVIILMVLCAIGIGITFLVFNCTDSKRGTNAYGASPKYPD